MKAAQLVDVGAPPRIVDVEAPIAGPGEVRVAVRACGICGSDLHLIEGEIRASQMPVTLGHEAAGVVDVVGDGVDLAIGTRVLINPIVTCGVCRACASGYENRCRAHEVLGVQRPGAHAEFVVVPARNVVPIPDSMDFSTAAILTDAVCGPFHAVRVTDLQPGDTAAVFGLGGLGLHAAMILDQVLGVKVIGVDAYDAALERASKFGISQVYDAREHHVGDRIRKATGGVDAAFEFVGSAEVIGQAMRSLRVGGHAVVMGITRELMHLPVVEGQFVAAEMRVSGSYGYTPEDLADLLKLIESGRLNIHDTITHTVGFTEYERGLSILRDKSESPIRVVLTTQS